MIAGTRAGVSGEKYLVDLLRILRPKSDGAFVDIGANIGQTLARVKLTEPRMPYYGFEPNPVCFSYLQTFIEANGWTSVALFPFGIGRETGVLELHTAAGKPTDLAGTLLPRSPAHEEEAVTINSAVFEFAHVVPLIRSPIAFLKIDVEGMELDVLRSCTAAIERDRPAIMAEMLTLEDFRQQHSDTVDMLRSLGYRVFLIEPDRRQRLAGLTEIRSYGDARPPAKADYLALTEAQIADFDPALVRTAGT